MKTTLTKRAIAYVAMSFVVAVIISSCKKNDPNPIDVPVGNTSFRLVNTIQGSPGQDFYANTTKLSTAPILYGESTAYVTTGAGTNTLLFKNTGTTTTTATTVVSTNGNEFYTVYFYSDGSGTAQITGTFDDNTAPTTGKAKVRFVNLALGLTALNITSTSDGTLLATGLGFKGLTAYANIDPAAPIDFTVTGSGVVSRIPASTFVAGKNYTVWFDVGTTTTAKYHVVLQN